MCLGPTTNNFDFSFLPIDNPENLGVAVQNPVHLSPIKENTKYLAFSYLSIMSIFRPEANPEYLGLDNRDPASFSNNAVQLQASTQPTML